MTWFGWVYMALTALGTLVIVAKVGKPRKPVDGTDAVCAVLSCAFFVVGALLVGTGHV